VDAFVDWTSDTSHRVRRLRWIIIVLIPAVRARQLPNDAPEKESFAYKIVDRPAMHGIGQGALNRAGRPRPPGTIEPSQAMNVGMIAVAAFNRLLDDAESGRGGLAKVRAELNAVKRWPPEYRSMAHRRRARPDRRQPEPPVRRRLAHLRSDVAGRRGRDRSGRRPWGRLR
jgi:hypothetical protein